MYYYDQWLCDMYVQRNEYPTRWWPRYGISRSAQVNRPVSLRLGPQLHPMPPLDLICQDFVNQPVLSHHRQALEFPRRNLDRIHRPAATGYILYLLPISAFPSLCTRPVLWLQKYLQPRWSQCLSQLLEHMPLLFVEVLGRLQSHQQSGGTAKLAEGNGCPRQDASERLEG